MSHKFENIRLVESILYTISKMLDENHSEADKKIIEKTIPQFKKDLADLWNKFDRESQEKIAAMLPKSWKWDVHVILSQEPCEDILA